ncbi:MAG: excinuclease ABC subunit UvrC [Chitinophagales bacterium]
MNQYIKEILPTIPHNPGIYKYFDEADTIIYVGKSKDLRKRVSSYFTKNHDNRKTAIMVSKIVRIEFAVVETEQDALLLENALIKKWQPRYNVMLRDDKSYPYICIKKERFPRIFMTRNVIQDGSEYLGPYTSTFRAKQILELMQNLFHLRNCNFNLSQKNIEEGKFKVCLEYHLGNCKGPCESLQSEEDYMLAIKQIKDILKGNIRSVIWYLKESIKEAAEAYRFEEAQQLKDKLMALEDYQGKSTVVNPKINNVDVFNILRSEESDKAYVSFFKVVNGSIIQTKVIELVKKLDESDKELLKIAIHEIRTQVQSNSTELYLPFKVTLQNKELKITVPKIGDKKALLDLAQKNAFYYKKQQELKSETRSNPNDRRFEVLTQLKKDLRMSEVPIHIECFDNSNIQGHFPVASMVIFRNGKPAKKEYRHFHIKTVVGPDDFASMEEVVYRRYKRMLDEKRELPQLIVIDGGKGQLSAAVKSLKKLEIYDQLAIIGIAKKLEEIYVPNDSIPLHIDKRSPALKLLQHLRNEAHRFAITFHRQIRSKEAMTSGLEGIVGVGKKTSDKLFKHFKSIKKIKSATEEELLAVVNKKQAVAIRAYFEANSKG